jgi:hypothetical protein
MISGSAYIENRKQAIQLNKSSLFFFYFFMLNTIYILEFAGTFFVFWTGNKAKWEK